MQSETTYVGMDVHARTIRVAVLGSGGVQREEWGLANEPRAVASLARRLLRGAPGAVVACYEAGPTGFALMRKLRAKGIDCRVIAPALIPRKPGERVKTDRRGAVRPPGPLEGAEPPGEPPERAPRRRSSPPRSH